MPESTELASGHITRAHELRVVMEESADNPPIVLIEWLDQATICAPHSLQATAAKATTILAQATVRLSQDP
jgi:hypothetical protein